MKESLNPTNVVDMGGTGIDSLRAKSGIVERQGTEAASDIRSIDDAAAGVNKADAEEFLGEAQIGNPFKAGSTEQGVAGILDNIGMTSKGVDASIAADKTGIMASVAKGDLPAKTASAREFLVNSLKVGDDYPSTTLSDVMSAEDMKYIFEGGGGAMGDPLVLVQKYFGPRIAEMVPKGGSPEEIAIFTKRVMDNVEDAKGFKPDEPEFDAMTAMFVDQLADGGRAGFRNGSIVDRKFTIMGSNNMTDAVIRRIEALEDQGLDFGSAYRQVAKEVPSLQKKDGGRINYAQGGLAKILEL